MAEFNVQIDHSPYVGFGVLRCPNCDGDYLHQVKVDAFWRKEDAATGIHEESGFGQPVHADVSMNGNPSPRRQGLLIHFYCELCDAPDLDLAIYQHKGHTFIAWVDGNG